MKTFLDNMGEKMKKLEKKIVKILDQIVIENIKLKKFWKLFKQILQGKIWSYFVDVMKNILQIPCRKFIAIPRKSKKTSEKVRWNFHSNCTIILR